MFFVTHSITLQTAKSQLFHHHISNPSISVGSEGVHHFLKSEEIEQFYKTAQNVVPQELLDTVVELQINDYKKAQSKNHEILAESFPAIAYTFGPKNWIYIKAIYMSFCVHENVCLSGGGFVDKSPFFSRAYE